MSSSSTSRTPASTKAFEFDSVEIPSIYFNEGDKRLNETFFNVSCVELARNLLGTVLVRRLDGFLLKGKIVETECYLGLTDRASHSYRGRTSRNEPMFMEPGTIYVYQTYGMYHCINISSEGANGSREGAAVLLRAVEPVTGLEKMSVLRSSYHLKRKKNSTSGKPNKTDYKLHELCNGPSKLCISFDIDIETFNKNHLSDCSDMWIEEGTEKITDSSIICSTRIGIDSAGAEWAGKLLRFYVFGNKCVSIRDKKREAMKLALENGE